MLKDVRKMLFFNFKTLVIFELFFKIVSLIIFSPLFMFIFNGIMKLSGFNYLTFENIFNFLLNPITIIMMIFFLLLLTVYTIFDISTIIIILDASRQEKKIMVKDAVRISWQKSVKVFKLKNLSLAFLVLFLIPFLNIGLATGFVSSIKIPEFIMDFIMARKDLTFLFILVSLLLMTLLLRWIYSLHYYILEDCDFKTARIKSENLSRHHHIKDISKIILSEFGLLLLYLLFILGGIILIIVINYLVKKLGLLNSFLITIIWLFIAVSLIIYTLFSTPISYACISWLYYSHKKQKEEKIKHIQMNDIKEIKNSNKIWTTIKISIVIVTVILGTIFTKNVINGNYNLNIEYVKKMEVTAHRGASVLYPENTMSAFVGAKNLGADWIELDVQQTKDGKIIVMHDINLKRTAGLNKNTWEVTYEEIKNVDVGSFKDEAFKDEKIPLLEDVIKWAKENNMKLNIELKPTGNETNFEASVIDIIKRYAYEDYCVITSQVYSVLENVKKYDESVTTVYVMSLAYGEITSLDKADNFSIESTSITKTLVASIHNEGKELYAWTVNSEENINKMIDLNVDNIITDDISLAKELVYKSKTSNLIWEFVKVVENLF